MESEEEEVVREYKVRNRIAIWKKFDDGERVELEEGENSVEELLKWNRVPRVMELGTKHSNVIFSEQAPCLFLLLRGNDTEGNEVLLEGLKEARKGMERVYVAVGRNDEEMS